MCHSLHNAMSVTRKKTREYFTRQGYTIDKVDCWNAYSGKTKDLFSVFDMVAVKEGEVVFIQICGKDFQPHVGKMKASPVVSMLSKMENITVMLIGWRKLKGKWTPRIKIF